jgi:hypothetical protein
MRSLFITLALIFPASLVAQKIKIIEGSLSPLKGLTEVNIKFTYDNLAIGTDTSEKDYVELKKAQWNAKEAGKGDEFENYWNLNRKSVYESIFVHHFTKNSGLVISKTPAKYTVIINTRRIEPGWNGGVVSKSPAVEGDAWIVHTDDPKNAVGRIVFENCSGDDVFGGDFEMARRIQSAYYVAATQLFISKKL